MPISQRYLNERASVVLRGKVDKLLGPKCQETVDTVSDEAIQAAIDYAVSVVSDESDESDESKAPKAPK